MVTLGGMKDLSLCRYLLEFAQETSSFTRDSSKVISGSKQGLYPLSLI